MMESAITLREDNSIKEEPHKELDTQFATTLDSQQDDYKHQEEQLFPALGKQDSCDFNWEFAVICSFLARFGERLDLTLNIEQLKASLENQTHLDEELINLHVKLLKKTRRYFVRDQWEKALIRFAGAYSYEAAYELESFGYLKARPSIKLELLRRLLDAQFECDQKFKAVINTTDVSELRVPPTGRDVNGNTYWHEVDSEGNLRVFHEQPLDHQSWKAVCHSNHDLDQLIKDLEQSQGQILKGEPMLEPYNPLPHIFPEIFLDENNQLEAPLVLEQPQDNISNNHTKKNPPNRNAKHKSETHLKTVKEEEEGNDDKPCNIKLRISLKQQTRHDSILQHTCILSTTPQEYQRKPHQNINDNNKHSSVESQVRSTLECILNQVNNDMTTSDKTKAGLDELSTVNNFVSESQNHKEEPPPVSKALPKKKSNRKEKSKEESAPRRTSSRIQQLQMKKIAEEEEKLKRFAELKATKQQTEQVIQNDDDSKSGSNTGQSSKRKFDLNDDESSDKKRRRKRKNGWKRGKDKKKLSWDKDDSDLSSTSSPTESNDDFDDDLEDSFKFENYDDEFACEDEETSLEPVIVKRARTAKQSLNSHDASNVNLTSMIEEDKPCRRCDKSNDPEWILLCDMCDDGYHTSCCIPPLMIVPDGDWYCPCCEHKMLLIKLKDVHFNNSLLLKIKERERAKNEILRQTTIKKERIKEEPPLPSKRPTDILPELNDSILVQALDEDSEQESMAESNYSDEIVRKPKPKSHARPKKKQARKTYQPKYDDDDEFRVKKKPRRTYSRRQASESDESENDDLFIDDEEEDGYNDREEEDDEDDDEGQSCSTDELQAPKARRARASVSYRFKEYDELIQSAIHGDSYDEDDENGKEEEEEEGSENEACNYGKGKDMATIEALAYQQENGLPPETVSLENNHQQPEQPNKPARSRKKGRRLNDLDAASESGNTTSDESFQASSGTDAGDDEDEDLTEADLSNETETSIDELIDIARFKKGSGGKKKKRKEMKKRNSYESDDSDWQPSRTRRVASLKISYRESTDEECQDVEEDKTQPIPPICISKTMTNNHSPLQEKDQVKVEMNNELDRSNSLAATAPESMINSKIESNGSS